MKIETILNAMEKANIHIADSDFAFNPNLIDLYNKRVRQYNAFRARILRIDADKDYEIAVISNYFEDEFEQLEDCRKEIIEKDEEIRVLEKYIKDHDYKTILDYMEKYLEGDME